MAQTSLAALRREYTAYCKEHADEENVRKYSRYFREGFDAYGCEGKALIAYHKELLDKYEAQLTPDASLELGRELLATGKYEDAALAIALAKRCLKQLQPRHIAVFAAWLDEGVTNWAISDVLCSEVLSKLLLSGVADVAGLTEWRDEKSRWRRRALAVTLIPLAKRERHVAPLLECVLPMLHDTERVVHQGLGWFLRECWKVDPQPVEQLLARHKETAPRLTYQYACEKMAPEQRELYRRTKAPKK
jgi:3-methyladenine DNA glycosylase AlkD